MAELPAILCQLFASIPPCKNFVVGRFATMVGQRLPGGTAAGTAVVRGRLSVGVKRGASREDLSLAQNTVSDCLLVDTTLV